MVVFLLTVGIVAVEVLVVFIEGSCVALGKVFLFLARAVV